MTTTLPHDFPGLMDEAGRLADELLTGLGMELCPRDALVRSQARLLADLTRRESQGFWLRALAARCELPSPTVGAPLWRFNAERALRTLSNGDGASVHFVGYDWGASNAVYAPALIGVADPVEALYLALFAAFGVSL